MNAPGSAREVLIAEAIGDLGRMIDQVQALQASMVDSRQALVDAHTQLADQFATFQTQVVGLTERSKVVAMKHILARTEEAARQSADLHSRAMADAARVAFGAEIGAALQRMKALHEHQGPRWEQWLTHAAAAVTASAGTLMWAVTVWAR